MRKKYPPRSVSKKRSVSAHALHYGALVGGALAIGVAVSASSAIAQEQAAPSSPAGEPAKKAAQAKKAAPSTGGAAKKKAPASGATPATTAPAAQSSAVTLTGTSGGTVAVAPTPGVANASIQDVVVTARLREENLQDVPIPVTAVSGDQLDKEHQATVKDFAQKSPSLTVNAPNARQSSIAIRGVGKNIANEALEASVGVIVDGVFVALPGLTWGDYADLERFELLRGPQGTLLGKNTTLGVLNVVTKAPSFTPEKELEVTYGNRNLFITKGTATGTLIENTLAYRASVYFDYQDAQLRNDAVGAQDVNAAADRWGGRLQFLYTPNANVTNRTIIDHSQSDERNVAVLAITDPQFYTDNGAYRVSHPAVPSAINPPADTFTSRLARFGYTPSFDSWKSVDLNAQRPTKTEQNGISTQTDWKLEGGYVVTSITAYKTYHFDALNDADYTHYDIGRGGYLVDSWAGSQELRLSSPKNQDILGQKFDWQTGLYALRSETSSTLRTIFGADAGQFYSAYPVYANFAGSTAGREALRDSLNNIFLHQVEHPDTTSLAAYGQTTWHATQQADLTLGLRNTYEEKTNWTQKWFTGGTASDSTGVRNTVAVPFTLGTGKIQGQEIDADSWSWLINPSYKITPDILAYASYSHGEKSGAVQFDQISGAPLNVAPEKVEDYEIGFKTNLFDKKLTLNPNLYWTEITDYQATLGRQISAVRAVSYLGNVPGVRIRGVELEGIYKTPIEGLVLNFGGAYNDGIFTSYKNAQCPGDLSYSSSTLCDFTGQRFSGTSRWIGNIGFNYERPIFDGYTAYFFASETYRSRVNYGVSDLTWQNPYSITNAGLGFRPDNGAWDVSIWGKNIFDTHYFTFLGSVSQTSPILGMPGDPLQFGVTFRTKL
jgi:iron complex outermembrane recepter protein